MTGRKRQREEEEAEQEEAGREGKNGGRGEEELGGNGDGDREMDLAKVETKTQKRGGAGIKEGEAQKVFAEGISAEKGKYGAVTTKRKKERRKKDERFRVAGSCYVLIKIRRQCVIISLRSCFISPICSKYYLYVSIPFHLKAATQPW